MTRENFIHVQYRCNHFFFFLVQIISICSQLNPQMQNPQILRINYSCILINSFYVNYTSFLQNCSFVIHGSSYKIAH